MQINSTHSFASQNFSPTVNVNGSGNSVNVAGINSNGSTHGPGPANNRPPAGFDSVSPIRSEQPPSQDFGGLLNGLMQAFDQMCQGQPPQQDQGPPPPGGAGAAGGPSGGSHAPHRGHGHRGKQVAKGGPGNDKIVQKGARRQVAKGGRGNDRIVQKGGKRQVAHGGRGNDTIVQQARGGSGSSVVRGGRGNDRAVVKAGKNITVRDGSGKVLFQRGNGGQNVTVSGVEDLRVVNGKGKSLFRKKS